MLDESTESIINDEEQAETAVKMNGYARAYFRHIEQSKQYVPCTTFAEVDLSRVQELRRVKKYSYTTFFIHAISRALKNSPYINSSFDTETGRILLKNRVNLGVALDNNGKLLVPVIRDADKLSLAEIDAALKELRQKAEQGKLKAADLDGATFTMSNSGTLGSLFSTPVISYPQSAVLGIGGMNDRPVVRDGEIVIRPISYMMLTYDHRIVEGRVAIGFIVDVRDRMQNMTLD